MSTAAQATRFAPAEREAPQQVEAQSRSVQAAPLLRQLFNAVPDIVLVLNDKRQIVYANQQLLDLLGCSDAREVCGLRPGEAVRCIHSDEEPGGCGTSKACRYCGAVLSILASQRGERDQRECRILCKGKGDALTLRVTSSPFDVGGKPFTVFAVNDVSQEKGRKVLQRLLFQGILDHARDVREAVAVVDETNPESLLELKRQAGQLSTMLIEDVNGHRILQAAEEGELRAQLVTLESVELLQKLVDHFASRPEAHGRTLRLFQSKHVTFSSDRVLLTQVLSHLIRNALEASGDGETVTLKADTQGDAVTFSVHNPGAIPEDAQLQIFQRGFTTKGEGRGIGTFAARLLCERYLGGAVRVKSTEWGGTVFSVDLPRSS